MGQGHYTAIVWGIIYNWHSLSEDDHPIIEKWKRKGLYEDTQTFFDKNGEEQFKEENHYNLKTSYESDPSWLGFMVADNDGNINFRYDYSTDGDPYPPRGLLLIRKTISLSKIEEEIIKADPTIINKAKTAWSLFSEEMKNSGVTLPDPEFLLVTDWD